MDFLVTPASVLSIVVASLYGGLFHLMRGEKLADFVLYWLTALVGFGLGQVLGNNLHLDILMIGQVHILEASVLCWLGLIVVKWLRQ